MPKTVFFIALLFLSPSTWSAEFKVTVDKTDLSSDEHLTLTLKLINSDTRLRAEGIDPNIDLTLLTHDFDVGTPKSTFRYRLERTHGRATSRLTIPLFPKHNGTLKIPAFHIDGMASHPITIHVLKKERLQSPEVFTETGLTRNNILPGESTLLYMDMFHRVKIKSASLGGNLDSEPARLLVERLPEESRTEKRNGIEYQVTRSLWFITPQTQDTYHFYVPDIWVETAAGKRLRFPVKKESLTIRALPENISGTLLIGKPEVYTRTDLAQKASAGEMLSWEFIIKTDNHASRLPERLPLPDSINTMRLFYGPISKTSEIKDNQVITTAHYPLSIIPEKAGSFTIPAIKLPYLDKQSGTVRYSSSQPVDIKILPAHPMSSAQDQKTNIHGTTEITAAPNNRIVQYWQTLSAALFCLWLATLYRWKHRHRPSFRSKAYGQDKKNSHSSAKERLLTLLNSATIEEGLQQWQTQYGDWPQLENLALQIQQSCYTNASVDTTSLEKSLRDCEREAKEKRKKNNRHTPDWQEKILTS